MLLIWIGVRSTNQIRQVYRINDYQMSKRKSLKSCTKKKLSWHQNELRKKKKKKKKKNTYI